MCVTVGTRPQCMSLSITLPCFVRVSSFYLGATDSVFAGWAFSPRDSLVPIFLILGLQYIPPCPCFYTGFKIKLRSPPLQASILPTRSSPRQSDISHTPSYSPYGFLSSLSLLHTPCHCSFHFPTMWVLLPLPPCHSLMTIPLLTIQRLIVFFTLPVAQKWCSHIW